MKGSREINYRYMCRKQEGRLPMVEKLDYGLAVKYGNDFAIFIQMMIEKQKDFSWHHPENKGTFFLTNEDIMEVCRFTRGQTLKVKRKARELNIIPKKAKMLSRNYKDTKVTREWFDINWEALWTIFHESAISKSTWQMAKNQKDVNTSLSTDLENPTEKVPYRNRHGIYYKGYKKDGVPYQSHTPSKRKSKPSTNPNDVLKALFQENKDTNCPNGMIFIRSYNLVPKKSKCHTCPIKDVCGKLHNGNITFDGHIYYMNRVPIEDDGRKYYLCEDGKYRNKASDIYFP
jgi:hypothetical protein